MTKPRAPLSLDAALTRVAASLEGGWAEMAEIAGHSQGYLRACSDPDRREQLALRDALLLDRACHAAGAGTPLFDFYRRSLDRAGALSPAAGDDLAAHAIEVIRECGEAHVALLLAGRPGSGFSDRSQARREVEEVIAVLDRARVMLVGHEPTGPPFRQA